MRLAWECCFGGGAASPKSTPAGHKNPASYEATGRGQTCSQWTLAYSCKAIYGRKIWRAQSCLGIRQTGPQGLLFFQYRDEVGELLLPLVHCVLTKSLPLITARIQKGDWVRVWPVRGTTCDPTAVFSIAPATVTRLRKYHNGPGKRWGAAVFTSYEPFTSFQIGSWRYRWSSLLKNEHTMPVLRDHRRKKTLF